MGEQAASTRRNWFAAACRWMAFLVGGLVISVVVAQACALWSDPSPRTFADRSFLKGTGTWQNGAPQNHLGWKVQRVADPDSDQLFDRLERDIDPKLVERFGGLRQSLQSELAQHDSGVGLQVERFYVFIDPTGADLCLLYVLRAGFPWPCVTAKLQLPSQRFRDEEPDWVNALTPPDFLVKSPNFNLGPVISWRRVLPFKPVWSGLVLNTACYSACLWALLAAAARLRRRIRFRAGRCVECGYSLAGLNVGTACPECGAARARVPASATVMS